MYIGMYMHCHSIVRPLKEFVLFILFCLFMLLLFVFVYFCSGLKQWAAPEKGSSGELLIQMATFAHAICLQRNIQLYV